MHLLGKSWMDLDPHNHFIKIYLIMWYCLRCICESMYLELLDQIRHVFLQCPTILLGGTWLVGNSLDNSSCCFWLCNLLQGATIRYSLGMPTLTAWKIDKWHKIIFVIVILYLWNFIMQYCNLEDLLWLILNRCHFSLQWVIFMLLDEITLSMR
jgi:hypothetical protein